MKVLITDLGAIGDGSSLNTEAVQKAVDLCFENGGGTVVVPQGVFVTGTIELKSGVTLYLDQGAILKGSENIDDYEKINFKHPEWESTISLIFALNQTGISIRGDGTIDLSGDAFMKYSNSRYESVLPAELSNHQFSETECDILERPNQPILFHECRNMQISGVRIINSPCWTLTMSTCSDVKINNISVDNNLRVPNSDGIHLCACKDVIVSDCVFSCGDDCIAVTCITNWDEICERIVISNCTMRTRSAGIRLGHLKSKIRNVVISNIIIYESNRGIGIFAGKDGYVSSVNISGVIMETHMLAGNWWGKGEPLVISSDDSNSKIENISISNVKAVSENGILVIGKNKNIGNILLKDWTLNLKYSRNRELFGTKLDIQPAEMLPAPDGGASIPWLYAKDLASLYLDCIRFGKDHSEHKEFNYECMILDVAVVEKEKILPLAAWRLV